MMFVTILGAFVRAKQQHQENGAGVLQSAHFLQVLSDSPWG
jgi:hypothetical protein